MSTGLIEVSDARQDLSLARNPEEILAEAQRAAKALQDVIRKKAKPVNFNGEQYLEFEDWQTAGRFYGVTCKIEWTRPVEFSGVKGFEARATVLEVRTGMELSAAEAMCLNDEEKWRARPKYEYHYVKKSGGTCLEDPGRDELIWEDGKEGKKRPKKTRIHVGEEAVPLFQLRSMAQTRAGAKALRNVLAWVVVLAGYKPTPAEEMTGQPEEVTAEAPAATEAASSSAVQAPQRKSQATPAAPVTGNGHDAKTLLWQRCLSLANGVENKARDMLQNLTTFTNSKGERVLGKRDISAVSDKAAAVTLSKIDKQAPVQEPDPAAEVFNEPNLGG